MDDLLLFMGLPCSSYVCVSRGSTDRSELLPMGSVISSAVYLGNKVASRLVK